MKKKFLSIAIHCLLLMTFVNSMGQTSNAQDDEMYRSQIHFSPRAHWINDPNGMVFSKGIYHLFYQYHPYSSVWGPMHWGHATSADLIHWKEQAIAIYPDSLGTIFSGSAVIDKNNSSGFGRNGKPPMIAIFTQYSVEAEKAGRKDFQNQSIAYSNDDGATFTKYAGNPVLKNPGITDFRDPKVMWYASQKKWIMTLATKDHITFYSSTNLKSWKKESEFGATAGAHDGVWECPDLFALDDNGKKIWVLIVSVNPGGPNKGSATQYFLGNFDGHQFTALSTDVKWLDYGPDNYAGVTWSNTGKRKIFLGWMSNWLYANMVPTQKWKNAMTIPRELTLKHSGKEIFLASQAVAEISTIQSKPIIIADRQTANNIGITDALGKVAFPCRINLAMEKLSDFSLAIANDNGEDVLIGFDKKANQYYIDRTRSGRTEFNNEFAGRHTAPRLRSDERMNISLLIDKSSVELFADDGLTVMTEIFFSNRPYTKINLKPADITKIKKIEYIKLQH